MAPEPITTKPPTLAHQVSRAVVWNTLFVPLRLVAEVLATLLKLTLLAPASYGLLTLIGAANNAFGTWIDLGTGRALPKYIPETLQAGGIQAMRRLMLAVFGIQIGLLALVGLGFMIFHDAYLDDLRGRIVREINLSTQADLLAFVNQYGSLIIGAVLMILLTGILYDVLMAYLSSFFQQRAWNSVALVAGILPPLLTAAAILLGWDVGGVLAAMVCAPTIATLLLIWQANRHYRLQVTSGELRDTSDIQPGKATWLPPGFVRYCGVSFLMTATDFLASVDFVVFFVPTLVGSAIIKAGVSIVRMLLGYLYTPMVGVQVPLFTRVRAGEGGTLNGAYQSIVRLQVLLLVPGGVGLILLAHPIFAVLFPRYTDAAPLVWVLVPCLFLECLLTTAHNVLIVYEHLRIIVISRVLTLVSVPLVLVLTPMLGPVGAALAFGLARVVAGAWVTANGVRLLELRWPWRFTLRVLLASAAMAVLVVLLLPFLPVVPLAAGITERLMALPLLLAAAAAGGAAFVAALRLTGGLDPQDREQLTRTRVPGKKWLLKIL